MADVDSPYSNVDTTFVSIDQPIADSFERAPAGEDAASLEAAPLLTSASDIRDWERVTAAELATLIDSAQRQTRSSSAFDITPGALMGVHPVAPFSTGASIAPAPTASADLPASPVTDLLSSIARAIGAATMTTGGGSTSTGSGSADAAGLVSLPAFSLASDWQALPLLVQRMPAGISYTVPIPPG